MENLAVIALCLLSSFASAKDIEELVVTAKRIRIVIEHLSTNHKQNPITGNWHYVQVAEKEEEVEEFVLDVHLLNVTETTSGN